LVGRRTSVLRLRFDESAGLQRTNNLRREGSCEAKRGRDEKGYGARKGRDGKGHEAKRGRDEKGYEARKGRDGKGYEAKRGRDGKGYEARKRRGDPKTLRFGTFNRKYFKSNGFDS